MNLYIIENVLKEERPGMIVIAAPSLERCKELFAEEWPHQWFKHYHEQFDRAIKRGYCEVIEDVNIDEKIISYVYG